MSNAASTINNDHAEYGRKWLVENKLADTVEVLVANSNQLQIDYDATEIPGQFYVVLDILLQHIGKTFTFEVERSKSGNLHVTINLPFGLPDMQRVAWQAAFGSDGKREALNLLSISRAEYNPILFYKVKANQPIVHTVLGGKELPAACQ